MLPKLVKILSIEDLQFMPLIVVQAVILVYYKLGERSLLAASLLFTKPSLSLCSAFNWLILSYNTAFYWVILFYNAAFNWVTMQSGSQICFLRNSPKSKA